MTRKHGKVTDVDFVTAWKGAGTHEAVVALLGLQLSTVYARASKLRKLGVALPKLRIPREKAPPCDVTALNAILDG